MSEERDLPWIIVSAHHCAPDMGSEHAVGWNLVSRIAREHPVLLITQDDEYRARIEAGVAALRAQGLAIRAFFVRHGARTDGRRNNLRLYYYLTYGRYQRRVLALAQSLVREYRVAAVHHLTIVGFREPGLLWRLGRPFIWGPVGGLVFVPPSLRAELPWRSRVQNAVRASITRLQFALSPRVRAAYRAAQAPGSAFVAATPDIGEAFVRRYGGRFVWIPETGAHEGAAPPLPSRDGDDGPLRLLWIGALVDRKPMGMLLDAIAAVPDHRRRISLLVVGDGQSRHRYQAHASRLGVNAEFLGWCSHAEVQRYYERADLFALISVLDLTTNVVFESLAHGVPVLCLDHHGYANVIDGRCGVKVPVGGPQEVRARLAQALERLAAGRRLIEPMRAAAIARAREFSWDRNAHALSELMPKR